MQRTKSTVGLALVLSAIGLSACAQTGQSSDPINGPTIERRTALHNGSEVTVWWDRELKNIAYIRFKKDPIVFTDLDYHRILAETTGCEHNGHLSFNRTAPEGYQETGYGIRCN